MTLAGIMTSRDVTDSVPDLDALFDRAELIVVASPNATHFDIAKRALQAGKHVLVDKPFTATVQQADELIALAEDRARKLSVFHNRRLDGDFLTVRQMVSALGDIALYEAHWDRFRPALREGWKEVADGATWVGCGVAPWMRPC